MFKGIDVSVHNGKLDWDKMKKAGIQFAMIRAGYGQNNIDGQFKRNITECNRVGIPCGVYWFSYALNEGMARQEAQYCLAAVKGYKLEYPIAFDFEYDSVNYAKKQGVTITKVLASKIAIAFCSEIEKAGYYVLNYANPDYLSNYFNADVPKKFGLWLAAWNNDTNPPRECKIWQYGVGKVSGFSGDFDLNRGYVDFPALIKEKGLNGFKKPEKVEKYYSEALKWGVENGITDGANPEAQATRAQVITMLYRFYKKFKA